MEMVNSSVVVSASCSLLVYAYDSANLSSLQSVDWIFQFLFWRASVVHCYGVIHLHHMHWQFWCLRCRWFIGCRKCSSAFWKHLSREWVWGRCPAPCLVEISVVCCISPISRHLVRLCHIMPVLVSLIIRLCFCESWPCRLFDIIYPVFGCVCNATPSAYFESISKKVFSVCL